MKKILITGVAGFIGSNLAEDLILKKNQIFGLDNLITGSEENLKNLKKNPLFSFLQADLIDFNFDSFFSSISFDIVYHLASPASPKQYQKYSIETLKANSLGTINLLEFMVRSKSKVFIFASTSEVYGDPLIHPQREDYYGNVNSFGWRACYDEGKRFGEACCYHYSKKYGLDIRIARIFNTYGPNMEKDDGRVISNFITQALEGKEITIYGDGSQTRSFCYITDMIRGLKLMAEKKIRGEIINLGNPKETKIFEIAQLIKKKVNPSAKINFLPLPADDPKRRKPDISKAKKLLGWQPKVDLNDGLDLTIEYFKKRFYQ